MNFYAAPRPNPGCCRLTISQTFPLENAPDPLSFYGNRLFGNYSRMDSSRASCSASEFFSQDGKLGKEPLEQHIHEFTGIAVQALQGGPLSAFSHDERRSWAVEPETTLEEDQVYCLLGIFDVYSPLIYGEGEKMPAAGSNRKLINSPTLIHDVLSYYELRYLTFQVQL